MVNEESLLISRNMDLIRHLSNNRILPAITIQDENDALPLAEALLRGGLKVMEITFRTEAASASITQIRKHLPEMRVGAGTLIHKDQVLKAIDSGAEFGLAPGFNPGLCSFAIDHKLEMIPGVITPSEVENAYAMGFRILKIFPISQFGGMELLKAFNGPFGELGIRYMPMGGVNQENFIAYLNVKNVIAVGGSWMTLGEWMQAKNFKAIEDEVARSLSKIIG